jgi:hypothetical protein
MGRDLSEIAMALIGVATIALLVSRSGDTVKVINAGTSGFAGLLRTVTLQNGYNNPMAG